MSNSIHRISLAIIILFLTIVLSGQSGPPSSTADAINQADKICTKLMKDENFPGMVVAVAIDGKPVWEKGYGYADVESKKTIDPSQTLFRIGSVSKTVASMALAQLVEAGVVDLDKEVQEYVDYFPKKKYPITVRQIGGHIAGIRHYRGNEFMNTNHYPTVKSGIDIFINDPLLFEPGTSYSYSSYGWNLISAVVEEVAQMPFLEYMNEHVFGISGMNSTFAEYVDQNNDRKVTYYNKDGNLNVVAPEVDNSYKWAGGGFIGTATDLLAFSEAVYSNKFVNSNTLAEFTTPQSKSDGSSTNYGIGWRSGEDGKGRAWQGHSGGSVGGSTMFLVYPEHNITVVTMVNLSSARTNRLAWKIAEQFLSVKAK